MRTVLATDEMLAYAIEEHLPGRKHTIGRRQLRELGADAVATLRALVTSTPSVLVMGARGWDALPMLRLMFLPMELPVVLLTPEATPERTRLAGDLGVFSIVPLDGSVSGLSSAVAVEARLGWETRSGRLPRQSLPPVLVRKRVAVPGGPPRSATILSLPRVGALAQAGDRDQPG
jgi:hypothetical protein